MARSPLRFPMVGGNLDASGNGTFLTPCRAGHWWSGMLAAVADGGGSPTWRIQIGDVIAGDHVLTAQGGDATVGPMPHVQVSETIRVVVTGGTPNTAVHGTFWGLEADTAQELDMGVMAPTISGLQTTAQASGTVIGSPVQLIDRGTVTAATSWTTNGTINQNFMDLELVIRGLTTTNATNFLINFNGDGTSAHYLDSMLFGQAGAAISNDGVNRIGTVAAGWGVLRCTIFDYTDTSKAVHMWSAYGGRDDASVTANMVTQTVTGAWVFTTPQPITAIQVAVSAGTFTGSWSLLGMPG